MQKPEKHTQESLWVIQIVKRERDCGWSIANGMHSGEGEDQLWVMGIAEIGQE